MVNLPEKIEPLIVTNAILSCFSIICCLIIIVLFITRKSLRSFVFSLVLYLSVTELLQGITMFLSIFSMNIDTKKAQPFCEFQKIVFDYTDISSLVWINVISYTLYDMMISSNEDFSKKQKIYIILGFILPLVNVIISFYTRSDDIFSDSSDKNRTQSLDSWCWLGDIKQHKTYAIVMYAIFWTLLTVNFIYSCRVINFLKNSCDIEDNNYRKIRKMINKLYLYPIIAIFCWVVATVHRFLQIFLDDDNDNNKTNRLELIFSILHGIFLSIRGFLFFVVYGCDAKVRKEFIIFGKYVQEKIFNIIPKWRKVDSDFTQNQ